MGDSSTDGSRSRRFCFRSHFGHGCIAFKHSAWKTAPHSSHCKNGWIRKIKIKWYALIRSSLVCVVSVFWLPCTSYRYRMDTALYCSGISRRWNLFDCTMHIRVYVDARTPRLYAIDRQARVLVYVADRLMYSDECARTNTLSSTIVCVISRWLVHNMWTNRHEWNSIGCVATAIRPSRLRTDRYLDSVAWDRWTTDTGILVGRRLLSVTLDTCENPNWRWLGPVFGNRQLLCSWNSSTNRWKHKLCEFKNKNRCLLRWNE